MPDDLVSLDVLVGALPDPVEFRRRVLTAVRQAYAAAAEGQKVLTPEDTFEPQLLLARTRELCQQYASAFTAADKELAAFQRDQLELLPGGVGSLNIPSADGDVRVQLDQTNTYSFDEGQLLYAVAASLLPAQTVNELIWATENAPDTDAQHAALAERIGVLLVVMVETVGRMGKLGLQVTKVRAFADQLTRDGDTALAGVVRDSIIKSTDTKQGAKFTRKEAKS